MNEKLKGKLLAFSPRAWDLREYEELGSAAKDAGFTHLVISELAERSDYRGEDKDSPWCEWSAILPSIFKHVLPAGLEDAYPAESVKRQMDFMKAKHRICEKLGMRAAYYGTEPHWLSERVYRKHPAWRGSRADNSLRSAGMFFAPNTDHPEVRDLYRRAVCEMLKQCPLIDLFTFNTNDSGAFYPWEKRMYVGINGPTGTQNIDMGKRVVDFLFALRQGAADAGSDAHFFTNVYGWFNDDETHLVLRSLKPGIGVNGMAPAPYEAECSLGGCGAWGGSFYHVYSLIDKFPTPMSVVSGAAGLQTSKALRFAAGGNSRDYFTALKTALELQPARHERDKVAAMHRIACAVYAEDVADDIVDAWYAIDRAEALASNVHAGIHDGPLMLRWITRPLVPHQELLTEEELSYWAPYIYQSKASQPDTWLDYLNRSGYRLVENWDEGKKVACSIDRIEAILADAARKLEGAAGRTTSKDASAKLLMDSYRVRVNRSIMLTIRHTVQMGTLIYLRDSINASSPKTASYGDDLPALGRGDPGSHGLFYMYRTMRWELDNTNELIEVMKKASAPLIFAAPHPSLAGPLYMESNVLENLEKKVSIMLKYWRTAETGYYRPTYGG